MTLLAEVLDIGDRVTDPVNGFRAPAGGSNRDWFLRFERLNALRRLAGEAGRHHITVLVDTIVLYANAQGEAPRDDWRAAYAAVRAAILREGGPV